MNKELINMTFNEIMEKKDLYDKNELNKYYHNLKVLKSKEINENNALKNIVNKKFSKLFEEYKIYRINNNIDFVIDCDSDMFCYG